MAESNDATDDVLIAELWRLRVAQERAFEEFEEMQAMCADYRKKLEKLVEWCESEARAYEKGSNGGDGFGFGYMNAMYAVAFRIREMLASVANSR